MRGDPQGTASGADDEPAGPQVLAEPGGVVAGERRADDPERCPGPRSVITVAPSDTGYAKADAYEGIEHGGNRRIRGIASSHAAAGHRPGTSPRAQPDRPALTTPAHHRKPDPRAEALACAPAPSVPAVTEDWPVTTKTPELAAPGSDSSPWGWDFRLHPLSGLLTKLFDQRQREAPAPPDSTLSKIIFHSIALSRLRLPLGLVTVAA